MTRRAFTLIELMVVIGVMMLLLAFSVPAYQGIHRARDLSRAGDALSGQFAFARQQAASRNCRVELRWYTYRDSQVVGGTTGNGTGRALQVFAYAANGTATPLGTVITLPSSIVIEGNTTFSSLESLPDQAGTVGLPRIGTDYRLRKVSFRPDGSTDLDPAVRWFLTARFAARPPAGTSPPPDFVTLQVDPVNGTARTFRPGA